MQEKLQFSCTFATCSLNFRISSTTTRPLVWPADPQTQQTQNTELMAKKPHKLLIQYNMQCLYTLRPLLLCEGVPLLHNQAPLLTPVGEVVVAATDVVVCATGESQDCSFEGCWRIVEEIV